MRTDRSKNRNHGEGRKAERSVRLISENPNHATRKKQKSARKTTHRTSGDERKGEARNCDRNQEQNKESQPRRGQPQRSSIRSQNQPTRAQQPGNDGAEPKPEGNQKGRYPFRGVRRTPERDKNC